VDIAGQPVESGDNEGGFVTAACVERGGELRAVGVAFAALDLLKLGEQGSAVREPADGGALGLKAKAAFALAFGRNPVVGHKRAHLERLYFIETVVSVNTKGQNGISPEEEEKTASECEHISVLEFSDHTD